MMKTIFSIITNAIFLAIVIVAGLLVLSTFSIGNWQAYTVLSGSMEPAIGTGSLILVSPRDSYEVGDIVTRETGGETTVTHRIIEKREEDGEIVFITQGDANDAPDGESVARGDILGKVAFHIPFFGRVVSYAKTQQGFILLIVIPSVLIAYEEVKSIAREIGRRRKKNKDRRCEKESREGTTTKQSRNSNPDGLLRSKTRSQRPDGENEE